MSWHFLPELVVDYLDPSCLGGTPSARWKKKNTAGRCSSDARGTVCYPCSRSGTMYSHFEESLGAKKLISSLLASPASPSRRPANTLDPPTIATSGPTPSGSYARWDRDSCCWRTYQLSLLTRTLVRFSGSWPRSGTMLDGIVFPRRPSVPLTAETDYGLWPTPRSRDWKGKGKDCLDRAVKMWPTPQARACNTMAKCKRGSNSPGGTPLPVAAGGTLNPPWVAWLMGWPIGWTALEPLATDRFQRWLSLHGGS